MSYSNDPMGAALDRHITGNYGEDQFANECEHHDVETGICCDTDETCPYDGNKHECDCDKAAQAAEDRRDMLEGR